MEININNEEEPVTIKINWNDTSDLGDIVKLKSNNLPLNGKYEDGFRDIFHYKNGKLHNENGPAYITKDGYKEYYIKGRRHRIDGPAEIYPEDDDSWWINGWHVYNETINTWLTENDIPLDWKIWTDSDKMMFALHWSDYNGEYE